MFIGSFKQDKKQYNFIYYNYDEFSKDTFSPLTEDIQTLKFEVKGKTYKERKAAAQELAIDWQLNFSGLPWSYGELAEMQSYFEKIGKRYGLIIEFRENCII